MSEPTSRIYPSAPLEEVVVAGPSEQKQQLLPPAAAPRPAPLKSPPSYDQAIATGPQTFATGPVPAATSGPHIVLVTNPTAAVPFGPTPMDMQCPFCHNFIRTRLRSKPTSRTHLIALILCLFQLYCCVCLPYCIASCMQTNHYCGMCDHYLGSYQRS